MPPSRSRTASRGRASEEQGTGRSGSLVVVGTGLMLGRHATLETIDAIRGAEHVFHLVQNPAAEIWVRRLNPRISPLSDCFHEGTPRDRSYAMMASRIVEAVRAGEQVCAVFYGHPGVMVSPAYQAVTRVRREGYTARVLPGISAEDCLFADLAIDPRDLGWQSFEATDFLLRRRKFDPTAALILWQVGVLGEPGIRPKMQARPERLQRLVDTLAPHYPPRQAVILYEAPEFPISDPVIDRIALRRLAEERIEPKTTLYVPPRPATRLDKRVLRWFTA
ncbi:MAG TPA: SAM-dependent methyltransferase [Vicinamibacterales bacterium]|nr:SAM-dependent methyltransferase [Vicinamibacterales bacterium]